MTEKIRIYFPGVTPFFDSQVISFYKNVNAGPNMKGDFPPTALSNISSQ